MLNALTVDVEDYFHVSAFEHFVTRDRWDTYPSRVVANTHRVLEVLNRRQTKGTFFVLGWIGERFPRLVRDIARDGHEIGCHSYWHELVYTQTPEAFRADLTRARDVLEQILGAPVRAYRAPSFSITAQSLWALNILAEEGFDLDSSIFPIYHDRYGIPNAQRHVHCLATEHGNLWEIPPSVHRWFRMNVPVAGGGYFRLYPFRWVSHCFQQIDAAGHACVFYVHPWELDPDQPRLPVRGLRRWRHYVNLHKTEAKLDQLLQDFSFGTLRDVVGLYQKRELVPVWPGVDARPCLGHAGSLDPSGS